MGFLNRLSVANKIGIYILIAFIAMSAYFIYDIRSTNQEQYERLQSDRQDIIHKGINQRLAQQFTMLAIGLTPILENQEIIEAFNQRDRELLEELTLPSMEGFRAGGVRQYQFHLPNAASFYRAHQPETFGDDLSSFRLTVVESNQTESVIQGLEGGVAGAGFRYVAPIQNNRGIHIGTVELGMGLTSSFLESLKLEYGGDWDFYAFGDGSELVHLAGIEAGTNKPSMVVNNEIMRALQNNQIRTIEEGTIEKLVVPLVDYSGVPRWVLMQSNDNEMLMAEMRRDLYMNLLISFVIIVLTVAILTISIQKMLSPIGKLTEVSEKISKNDLQFDDVHITSSHEFMALGNAFNNMNRKIRGLVVSLQEKNESLRGAAKTLKEDSQQSIQASDATTEAIHEVSRSANIQLTSVKETSQAMEEMAVGIGRVAETSTQVAESSNEMRLQAHKGNTSVKNSIDNISKIQDSVIDTSEIINELKKDSEQIGNIVKIISDISEQTNLLALNAAIEAARAGEAGRGFSVVADEIRKLADQTSQSTGKIYQIIQQIQSKTVQASSSMDTSKEQVQKGISVFEEVSTIFKSMVDSIESVATQIEDLSAIAEQMSAGSEEVTASVQELASASSTTTDRTDEIIKMAEKQLDIMERVVKAADELNDLAEDLQSFTKDFKI